MTDLTADDVPVPATEEAPVPPAEGEQPEEEEKRRRRRALLLLFLLGLLAMLATLVIWYLLFRQPITPLPPIPESRLPGYSTAIYGATNPVGVAVSPDGSRVYVTETEGERISRIFDAGGNQVGTMAPPLTTGSEHVPVWIAIDPLTSEVYITDRPTGQIYIYDRDGAYQRALTLAKPIDGWQPVGIAFDDAGQLYVSDVSGARPKIRVFDRQAQEIRTIGETSQLSFPNAIDVDKAGRVYVADSNNGRLLVFGPDGTLVAQVGRGSGEGNLGLPRGVAVDDQDRVYVGDATGQGVFVYRVPAEGESELDFVGFFGGEGIEDGKFEFPNGVAADTRGRVYVADTVNDRIQVWSY